jgi:DNA helicase II / ATP-dependent DNA helicase PcrA
MPHTPTPEQQAIIDAACRTSDSLLVNALAGAAKTTTLEMICHALPVQPILSLAFNKRIADEMAKRLPGHVQARTLNSVGHRVWMSACTGRIQLDKDKTYNLLKAKIEELTDRRDKRDAYDSFADMKRVIGQAKMKGYIPDGKYPNATRLTSSQDFWEGLDYEMSPFEQGIINDTLTESIRLAYAGLIDFDDQIYMPTLFGGSFPRFPLVLCDEVQDLSEINHAMLEKLVTQRLIAVGDPFQSIYGFRGAKRSGMAALQEKFSMKEMGLSISFRCPRVIVENARFRAPHMQYPDWAEEGLLVIKKEWDAHEIPDGAAIICRNNAPLFSLAFRLLRAGRGIKLVGFDIGPNLVRILKKLGPATMLREQVDKWERTKLLQSKNASAVSDKAECLRVFSSFGRSLGEAIAYAENLFKVAGPIQLLSGHKSKGLEWETVYHLDPWRIPSAFAKDPEDIEQEHNVRYVIETRAKKNMYLVSMKDFGDGTA